MILYSFLTSRMPKSSSKVAHALETMDLAIVSRPAKDLLLAMTTKDATARYDINQVLASEWLNPPAPGFKPTLRLHVH